VELSEQQSKGIDAIREWYYDKFSNQQVFRLYGYAGTGKTTLARVIEKEFRERDQIIRFAAYTGKAAHVLRTKGVDADTIHHLIYRLVESKDAAGKRQIKWVLNDESDLSWTDLLVVDEVSMVGEEQGRDLLSFGKKILVLGDPGQLPPISGAGFFTSQPPDYLLDEIHRQAADSPIIRLATDIRQGRMPAMGKYGDSEVQFGMGKDLVMGADQLLVGKNVTRKGANARAREIKGFTDPLPMPGDKLVCLRNNRNEGFMNGTVWHVTATNTEYSGLEEQFFPPSFVCDLKSEDDDREAKGVQMHREHFIGGEIAEYAKRKSNEFDFGYALTCHKAQGSQWPHVVVCDESRIFGENRWRWLYTAVTRAAQRVNVCKV
jgi:exodeoxyribonuclease-5